MENQINPQIIRKSLIFALFILMAGSAGAADLDWGPLYTRDTAPTGEERHRALGPLLEWRVGDDGSRLSAVRPVFSREHFADQRKTEQDVLWPIWYGKVYSDKASRWRFLFLMSWRNDDIHDPASRYGFRVLPFYFQGRDRDGNSYMAVFPLGGKIRNVLFYDEVSFVLFPLYGRTKVNDLHGQFVLWPIWTQSQSDDVERYRLFPFYGYSSRRDDFEKRFILWPFWTSVRYGFAGASGSGFVLFPFYGRVTLEDQESWMFLPPLFRFSRGAKRDQTHAPWPVVQMSSGDVEQLYFWPLWGRKTGQGFQSGFFIWPICMRFSSFSDRSSSGRFWVLPFVYFSDMQQSVPAPAVEMHSRKIWPLFTMHRENDHTLLRAPTLLPLRDFHVIDRNFAPLWTLYSRETTADAMEQEALWGIFRHRRRSDGSRQYSLFPLIQVDRRPEPDTLEWSLLKGAVGYRRAEGARSLRLLYFFRLPLGRQ